MFKFKYKEKITALWLALLFFLTSTPAHASISEIFTSLGEEAVVIIAALKIICGLAAFGCIIAGIVMMKKKASPQGGHDVKASGIAICFVCGVLFAGATWWLMSVSESLGAEITSF